MLSIHARIRSRKFRQVLAHKGDLWRVMVIKKTWKSWDASRQITAQVLAPAIVDYSLGCDHLDGYSASK